MSDHIYEPATHRLWHRPTPRSKWRQLACGSDGDCRTEQSRLQHQGAGGDFTIMLIGHHPAQMIGGR